MNARVVIAMSALAVLSAARAQGTDGVRSRSPHVFSMTRWYRRSLTEAQGPMPNAASPAQQAANPTPAPTPDRVTYHGGPVMQGYKAYTIFWAPPPHSIPASYQTLVNRWFDDVGGSLLLNVAGQYFQLDPPNFPFATVPNVSALGGTWLDTGNPYPHAGTAADPLLDADIEAEVQRAIIAMAWPNGGNDAEFLVLTASGVESCLTASKKSCTPGVPGVAANQQYLGYHSFIGTSSTIIYANLPYAATWASLGLSPNGVPDADLEIVVASHEQFESITDPTLDAWSSDADGAEIGDKCAGNYGTVAADGSNVALNGNPYIVQAEWSNAQAGCALGMLCSTQPEPGCSALTKSRTSSLQLKIGATTSKNSLAWKWNKGAATAIADFGDPLTATTYGLCVYDEADGNPMLLMDVVASAGSSWVQTATGFKYTNKRPTGNQLQQVTLRAGASGKAKISASGKGDGLPMPELPLEQGPTVIAQFQNGAGTCWEADYSSATKNSSTLFKAKSD
jgi:hypothetical protein